MSLNSIREKIAKLQEEAKVESNKLFEQGSKQLFNDHSDLKAFSWSQYTPYFNDGEPCEFGSNHRYFAIAGQGNDLEDFGPYEERDWDISDSTYKAVDSFLGQFNDDDMYNLFGDHVKVTVTKDGATVDEYDHD